MKKQITHLAILLCIATNISATDVWTQKTNFGGAERNWAVNFTIGTKGYVGTGFGNGTYYQDFWEYDQATDTWAQKANYGGGNRSRAVGFTIGGKGYVGTGKTSASQMNDFWEYDPATNAWTAKANFGGGARFDATGFSIGNKGYIGGGGTGGLSSDFWEYNPVTNAWVQIANHPNTAGIGGSVGFTIGAKGYVVAGHSPGPSPVLLSEMYEYDPSGNTWTAKASFGGGARMYASGFAIGNKGYVGLGYDGSAYALDFWEYNPTGDNWTQKTNFPAAGRWKARGFAIGNIGYFATGVGGTGPEMNDLWEWKNCDSIPGHPATISGSNTICEGAISTYTTNNPPDVISYAWTLPNGWTGTSTSNSITITAGSSSGTIVVTAVNACGISTAETLPVNVTPSPVISVNSLSICNGQTANLTANGGTTYSWSTGANSTGVNTADASPSVTTTYTVTGNSNGCPGVAVSTVTVDESPVISNISLTEYICSGSTVSFMPTSNVAGTTFSYSGSSSSPSVIGYSPVGNGNIMDMLTNSGFTSETVIYTITPTGPGPNSCIGIPSDFVVTVDVCLGIIEEISSNHINIFPNPFTSQTTITFSEEQRNTTLKITDILGKEIKTMQVKGKQVIIEKGEMKEGIYFVEVIAANSKIIRKKIIVN